MDVEKGLVSKVIELKDVRTPIKNKVNPRFFYGDSREVYAFIVDYYGQYGEVPTVEVIERYFPSYELERCAEPLQFYVDEVRQRQKYNLMVKGVQDVATLLEGKKVDEALSLLLQTGIRVNIDTHVTRDLDFTQDAEERLERYEDIKRHLGMIGIPYPWEALNESTGGMLDEELISIIGFQSVGKTWILLSILHNAWKEGKRVVLFTREMSPEQMERRLDALHFGLPYQEFKLGRLGESMEQGYKSRIHEVKGMPQFIISADDDVGAGVQAIRAKLEEYQPDIFGIDGAYLLNDDHRSDSHWEKIMHITQDCKRICRMMQIPGVITSQAGVDAVNNKEGVTLGAVAFSKLSFGADSDIVLGLDDLPQEELWKVKGLKMRENEKMSFCVRKDFRKMRFEQAGDSSYVAEGDEEETIMYGA